MDGYRPGEPWPRYRFSPRERLQTVDRLTEVLLSYFPFETPEGKKSRGLLCTRLKLHALPVRRILSATRRLARNPEWDV